MDGWMDEWVDGWVDGWMDGWVDGWMDGRMDGWSTLCSPKGFKGSALTHSKSLPSPGLSYLTCKMRSLY